MKFIAGVILVNIVWMMKMSVYGKGFLIRAGSGHHNVLAILGSKFRPKVFKGFPEKLMIALALDSQLT